MKPVDRRRLLQFLLASPLALSSNAQAFWWLSEPERHASIHEHEGKILVNNKPFDPMQAIKPGDTVETGPDSRLVFSQGQDAHLLRSNTRLEISNNSGLVDALRIVSGAVLSVFGRGRKTIYTPNATVGIRGTGTYFEVSQDASYLCTCYGETEMIAQNDPSVRETIATTHHESPRLITSTEHGSQIQLAEVKNHSDAELILLESTVGREPPFVSRDDYDPDEYLY